MQVHLGTELQVVTRNRRGRVDVQYAGGRSVVPGDSRSVPFCGIRPAAMHWQRPGAWGERRLPTGIDLAARVLPGLGGLAVVARHGVDLALQRLVAAPSRSMSGSFIAITL